ncbi:MAG: hypothetical protein HZC55_21715 [Verrucomicrobia bacterium]|nr:hypothetical protein [Verrucomicrobiota bacterium]
MASCPASFRRRLSLALTFLGLLLPGFPGRAASLPLAGGFTDHGVATPLSQHRGMVATVDGSGRDVMLVWLYDHRGGYALLMIDALTGRTEQFATPYPWAGDGPFASLLSSRNRYYTHFGSHFSEFDPVRRAFTFFEKTAPQMAMSLTEADDGTIWAATYPNCGLVSFDPSSRRCRDHGSLNRENWRQYPRSIATDGAGWVYVGLGSTSGQIIGFDPETGTRKALLAPDLRTHGYGTVSRGSGDRVYGQAPGGGSANGWEFLRGEGRAIANRPRNTGRTIIAGDQGLFHTRFPSGRVAVACDTIERALTTQAPAGGARTVVRFEYTSEGAHLVAVAAAPDGSLAGGTAFPMRMFRYGPAADAWENWPAHGQFNTVARQGDRFFVGGYGHGFLLEWNPAAAWIRTEKSDPHSNPRYLTECEPTINRPHDLLACPDGRTVVLAGTPGYGHTGGGLLLWDRVTGTRTLLTHGDLLPQLSTMSLVALPGGKFLGGTTTAAGTGGEVKAREAELYVFDLATRKIEWHAPVIPGVQTFTDLCAAPGGFIYGFADRSRFFVFDPTRREMRHAAEVGREFGSLVTGQGPRALLADERGRVFALFSKAIAEVRADPWRVEMRGKPPVAITAGGDILGGRLYFAAGSHLYSFALPP